jgi:hypothetical protein
MQVWGHRTGFAIGLCGRTAAVVILAFVVAHPTKDSQEWDTLNLVMFTRSASPLAVKFREGFVGFGVIRIELQGFFQLLAGLGGLIRFLIGES